jgi:predicted dehydrogenase
MIQIATPDWLHCSQTEMALAAGKHVLLQKPACLSIEELTRINTAWEKSDKGLQVLLNCRETRLSRTVKAALEAGLIGNLKEIRIAYRGRRFPISNPESLYLKAESGGVWLHNGLHWLDEAAFYAESTPLAVQVFANRNSKGEPKYVGDGFNYWSGYFMMENSVTFHFEYNTMLLRDGMPGGMRRVIIGSRGEIRQAFGEDKLIIYQAGEAPRQLPNLDDGLTPEDDVLESFRRALDSFAERIIKPERARQTTSDSLRLMYALLAGIESSKTGKTIFIGETL